MSEPIIQSLAALIASAMLPPTQSKPAFGFPLCPPTQETIDTRDNWGVPIFLPADPADNRPELDALVGMVRDGCRGVIDLPDEDWRVVCDELCYQIASHLAKNETIKLPSLGTLDIVYGEHGPIGRLTLAPEARP